MYTIQKKIYLLGFMGSGKSTIGKKLSKLLGIHFVDLDDYIISKDGRSIAEIFEVEGEDYFRDLETESLKELLFESPLIIALGGGAPCFNNNIKLINNTGTSIYLKVPIKELVTRLISEKSHRPLIKAAQDVLALEEVISEKLAIRSQFYGMAHHHILNESVDNSVQRIIDLVES